MILTIFLLHLSRINWSIFILNCCLINLYYLYFVRTSLCFCSIWYLLNIWKFLYGCIESRKWRNDLKVCIWKLDPAPTWKTMLSMMIIMIQLTYFIMISFPCQCNAGFPIAFKIHRQIANLQIDDMACFSVFILHNAVSRNDNVTRCFTSRNWLRS